MRVSCWTQKSCTTETEFKYFKFLIVIQIVDPKCQKLVQMEKNGALQILRFVLSVHTISLWNSYDRNNNMRGEKQEHGVLKLA